MRDELIPRPADWRFGPRRGWDLPRDFASAIAELPDPSPDAGDTGTLRASAVLIAIADRDGRPEVLLTKRSDQLRQHGGEISFPGGRMDPGETPVQSAGREGFEEVGVEPTALTVVGQLGHHRTAVSSSHIVPVVATLEPDVELRPNPSEVAHAFWVPLRDLAAGVRYHSELWTRHGGVHVVHFFGLGDIDGLDGPIGAEVVWGATARMLVDLFDSVTAQTTVAPDRHGRPRQPTVAAVTLDR